MSAQDVLRAWYWGDGAPWDYAERRPAVEPQPRNAFNPLITCGTCGKLHLASVTCDPQDLADVAEREADRRESSLIELRATIRSQSEIDAAHRRLDRALDLLARQDRQRVR